MWHIYGQRWKFMARVLLLKLNWIEFFLRLNLRKNFLKLMNMKLTCYQNAILSILMILLVVSCNDREKSAKDAIENAKSISYNILPYDSLLGNPYQISISDSILLIADNNDEGALVLYDIKNTNFVGRQLKVGQGPNEVIPPLLLARSNNPKTISVLQRRSGKYATYNHSDFKQNVNTPIDTLTFENTDRLTKTKSGFITTGEYEEGSIKLTDKNADPITVLNIYPAYIQKLKSIADMYILGQGHIAFNKQSNILAFAAFFTGEVLFYKLEDKKFTKLSDFDFSLNSDLKNSVNKATSAARIGSTDIEYFSDIFSTPQHFYLLYKGVAMQDRRSTPISYIFKFSSDGKFVGSYKTDIHLQSICVNNDDTHTYGIGLSEDFEYVIVEMTQV